MSCQHLYSVLAVDEANLRDADGPVMGEKLAEGYIDGMEHWQLRIGDRGARKGMPR